MMHLNWGDFSVPNALFTTLIVGGMLYYKMHRMRLTLQSELQALRAQSPPILIGEAFVAEHIETLERLVQELTARIRHVETMVETYHPKPDG